MLVTLTVDVGVHLELFQNTWDFDANLRLPKTFIHSKKLCPQFLQKK